jgi:hypothetical protein
MADKKPAKAAVKKFVVRVEVEGAMLDKDTPISAQALIDLFEMQFSNPSGAKIVRIDAQEA